VKIALGVAEGQVHLFLDEKGRDDLIESLKELEFPLNSKSNEHFHLFTEEWGGDGLVLLNHETTERLGVEHVHHLKVCMRPSIDDVW